MEGKLPEQEEAEVSPAAVLPGESRGEISGVLFGGYQILISEGSEYPFDRRA